MTGRENLEMIARLFGLGRGAAKAAADAVLEQLGLVDAADRRVRDLLGRHAPARSTSAPAWSARPAAPARRADHRARSPQPHRAVGRDPRPRAAAAPTCCSPPSTSTRPTSSPHDIVIIDHGRVIAAGHARRAEDHRPGSDVIEVHAPRRRADLGAVAADARPHRRRRAPRIDADHAPRRRSRSTAAPNVCPTAVRALDERGIAVDDIALRRPTLDEVFLALTGQALDTTPTTTDAGAGA